MTRPGNFRTEPTFSHCWQDHVYHNVNHVRFSLRLKSSLRLRSYLTSKSCQTSNVRCLARLSQSKWLRRLLRPFVVDAKVELRCPNVSQYGGNATAVDTCCAYHDAPMRCFSRRFSNKCCVWRMFLGCVLVEQFALLSCNLSDKWFSEVLFACSGKTENLLIISNKILLRIFLDC